MLIIVLSLSTFIDANEEIENLLNDYRDESKLSKITKVESAGYLEIYTRDELETMQAHTLLDVLKSVSGLHMTKTSDNVFSLAKPSSSILPYSNTRLYVNNHEMTSSSYGSAIIMWSDMPIEYIDHIEIYKITSSVEFGSEAAPLVVKLYTKKPEREEGGKVRLMAAENGAYNMGIYQASVLKNGLSYFVYANKDNIKKDIYYNYFETKPYKINSDKNGHNIFLNLMYRGWSFEAGSYQKTTAAFLGIGDFKTPSSSYYDAKHSYVHVSKKFKNELKVQILYDRLGFNKHYIDENGISTNINNVSINQLDSSYDDKVFSVIFDKYFKLDKHKLLLGGFYKNKADLKENRLEKYQSKFNISKNKAESTNIYSLYAEDKYDMSNSFQFIGSVKAEIYRYSENLESEHEYISRLGLIKIVDEIQFKAFLTDVYTHTENINSNFYNYGIGIKMRRQQNEYEFIYSYLGETTPHNSQSTLSNNLSSLLDYSKYQRLELKYKYIYNKRNKLYIDYFIAQNSRNINISPNQGLNVRVYNRYRNFDIYNELIYKNAYELYSVSVAPSFEYSFACKYHVSKDLSLGVKGDNIFNSGYKQVYDGYSTPVMVSDQRFWINLEYLY